jgi:S-adenosylmethionine:tRNA ribosyltransferase-isomerase
MKLSDFYYDLPPELIAKYPVDRRTHSRLMCLENKQISHRRFDELADLIGPNDLLVLNNTKVIPARFYGQKETGGKFEILIEKIVSHHEAWVHCRASKRPKIGQVLLLENKVRVHVMAAEKDLLKLFFDDQRSVLDIALAEGHIPLPPYLQREEESMDRERYQTVYAKTEGSSAAPTAGLHFDEALLSQFNTAYVTLHVGAGTFQSVRVQNIHEHVMHAEYAEVGQDVVDKILQTKKKGGRIIAVGTTTLRTLETAALSGTLKSFRGETTLFVKPGFVFHCVEALVTNFHLPESTLLMLVCAFGGVDNVLYAYQEAVRARYRFFSYGDAMWVVKGF